MKTTLRLLALLALTGCANALVDDVPRLYACDRAAGLNSCPGGWRCGLSGYCQDPAQALPYACESSDDCSASWHCGQEQLCYDRDAARDRPCRMALEASPETSDCAPGWRCGRQLRGEVCHQLDAGAGYLCTSDTDCEAGWRCGTEGACVDVAAQGLRVADVPITMSRVSPLLPSQVELLQLSVSPWASGSPLTNRLVFTEGNTLSIVTNAVNVNEVMPTTRASAPLLRPGHALAATDEHVLVTDSTGLVDYLDALDGGAAVLVAPALADAELRYQPATSATQEELASFSGTTVGVCGRGTNLRTCDPSTFQLADLPAPVNDVTFFDEDSTFPARSSVLAATEQGPFFAPRQGTTFVTLDGGPSAVPVWRPVTLPGLSGACATTPTGIDRVAWNTTLGVLAVSTDQDRSLTLFRRTGAAQPISACATLELEAEYGPCSACGPAERLVKLGIDPDALSLGAHVVTALCQLTTSDGGAELVAYRHQPADAGCRLEPRPLPVSVKSGYRVAQETFGLEGVDSAGVPRACPQAGCSTMLYDTAPDRVAGGPALLAVHNDDVLDENGIHQARPSGLAGPLGLERAEFFRLYVAGSVVENPDWMIGSSGSAATLGEQTMVIQSMSRNAQGKIQPFVSLNRSSNLLPSVQGLGLGLIDATATKAFGTITPDADGNPWLIVGAGDRIWAEETRLIVEDGGVRRVDIKAVPMPSADIQSLAFAAFDRGDAGTGPLLEGYTVEQSRLFRVRVHSAQLWLPDEIRIGETGIVPVSVWMEGKRGRVGTADGRVFGLPIPVPLSPTIPEAPLPTVLNYSSLCGQAFALSRSALYRLSSDTQPLGTWRRVSLEAVQPGLDTFGAHWSRTMHKARVGNVEHLYLFSETGLAIELAAACGSLTD